MKKSVLCSFILKCLSILSIMVFMITLISFISILLGHFAHKFEPISHEREHQKGYIAGFGVDWCIGMLIVCALCFIVVMFHECVTGCRKAYDEHKKEYEEMIKMV